MAVIKRLDSVGRKFLQDREGLRLTAYNNGDKWTIGYGNTYYKDGSSVKRGDVITKAQAETLFNDILVEFENDVAKLVVPAKLTQNQFNALVSYAYNRGSYRFAATKLIDMVIANPNDPNIRKQFEIEWGTATKFKTALINRRKLEAELYFTGSSASGTATKAGSLFFGLLAIGLILQK